MKFKLLRYNNSAIEIDMNKMKGLIKNERDNKT